MPIYLNRVKTGKMYLINQDGKKELIDTFITVAPKERSTLWEEYQRLGLPTRAMFYKERFYGPEANQMTDEDTKKEWEAQGQKCKVEGCNLDITLADFRKDRTKGKATGGCRGARDHCHSCKRFKGLYCTTHNLVINEIFGLTWRGIMKEIRQHTAECKPPPRKYWPGKTAKGRWIWKKDKMHNAGRPKGVKNGQGGSSRTLSRRKSGK